MQVTAPYSLQPPATTLPPDLIVENPAGKIPGLSRICGQLEGTFRQAGSPFNARQFEPVLRAFRPTVSERQDLLRMPFGKYVLVHNELLKVVLIHWEKGEETKVHGHPAGGCMFMVLEGHLTENRYHPADVSFKLSTHRYHAGALAYLDDTLALHDVRNESSHPAISLHAYTPGIYRPRTP